MTSGSVLLYARERNGGVHKMYGEQTEDVQGAWGDIFCT